MTEIVCYIVDKYGIHGEYNVNKEAAVNIERGMTNVGQCLSTIGSNLGLGATMVGVRTAVGKVITKSSMPPLQKAGVVLGSSIIAGIGHSVVSTADLNAVIAKNLGVSASNMNSEIVKSTSKFLDDSSLSPIQGMLFNIYGLNVTCLGL